MQVQRSNSGELTETGYRGLSASEVASRQAQGLSNRMPLKTSRSYTQIVRENVFSSINNILYVLGLALIIMGNVSDALVTVGVVLINVVVSVVQEVRAKLTLDKIALLNRPTVIVIREGQERQLDPGEVVVDDVLLVGPGDQLVVDGSLLTDKPMEVDESLLTGESELIPKRQGDRVYSGSFCVNGGGLYKAEQVGEHSMANSLTAGAKAFRRILTPLQREINLAVRTILLIALFFELLLVMGSLLNGVSLLETVRKSVVIIGIVPIGLFLAISVAYALGAVRIVGKGALVQQANAVESLSHVNVLCMDKTGTLTTSNLRLETVYPLESEDAQLRRLLGGFVASGSTSNKTSAAIGAACFDTPWPVSEELPFGSAHKWSGRVVKEEPFRGTYVLGAVEILQPALDLKYKLGSFVERESQRGLRVLLFAFLPEVVSLRDAQGNPALPANMIPLGLVSLSDELRDQTRETLAKFSEVGVDLKIISGDSPETVAALAKQAGLQGEVKAVSGLDLAKMERGQLAEVAHQSTVFGRITPQQKEQLVDLLRQGGRYVAMIGDGVNDVLSLKKADLGIAMQSGSQATRNVADIVLLNDSMATLPEAFGEGQRIQNGMQRILQLFLTRIFYVILLFIGALVISGFPFAPKQGSLLVLLTVGIPSIALAAWARPGGNGGQQLIVQLFRFVLPAAILLGIMALLVYLSEYELVLSSQLYNVPDPTDAQVVLAIREALSVAQTALTSFAVFCGIVLLVFVEPPNPFWAVINPLNGDRRIPLLMLVLLVIYLVILSVPFLRSFFELTSLGTLNYLVIIVMVLIWTFLLRWTWRFRLLERFFGVA